MEGQGLDASDLGIEAAELDRIIGEFQENGGCREADVSAGTQRGAQSDDQAVIEPGDIWKLGTHRLICTDLRQLQFLDVARVASIEVL